MAWVSPAEKRRRRNISLGLRRSGKAKAYHIGTRGVKRGPEPAEVRAKKSASKQATAGTKQWQLYYEQALERITLAEKHTQARRRRRVS